MRKCANNSAIKYIKNLKKIINLCLANGWLDRNPFINYKGKIKLVDQVFLNQEELNTMAQKVFATDRLNQIRDIYLFCCFTGLAYADVQKLKKTEILKGVDNELWIMTTRKN